MRWMHPRLFAIGAVGLQPLRPAFFFQCLNDFLDTLRLIDRADQDRIPALYDDQVFNADCGDQLFTAVYNAVFRIQKQRIAGADVTGRKNGCRLQAISHWDF